MKPKLDIQARKVEQKPGIYIFKNKTGEFLYIGKASNLRNRLKQYFNKKSYTPFLKHILNEAEKIETKTTESEVEALILESKLIKERQPKYNIMLRDDKQYFYVGFTKEDFPKIFITHQPRASGSCPSSPPQCSTAVCAPRGTPSRVTPRLIMHSYIGPFTDGLALKTTLKLLRRIFPFCTCKKPHHNFCLNYHIGKCLGVCCLKQTDAISNPQSLISNKYKKNIKAIKDILSGRRESLVKKLRKELNQLAKNQKFEKAIELRNKVEKLERVFENAKIINRGANDAKVLIELKKIFKLPGALRRIEGYDISNIQGENATGAMVVFTNGQPDKNEYRKFKIKIGSEPLYLFHDREINTTPKDDTAMLKEILLRRLKHPEWPSPDLIFIDGGKGQLNAAERTTAGAAIISLAKGKNEVFSSTLRLRSGQAKPVPMKRLPVPVQNLIMQIDSEAHRFAISYYRKIHRRALLKIKKPE